MLAGSVVVLVVAGGAGCWVVVRSIEARTELETARTALAQAREDLLAQRVDAGRAEVAEAGRHTARARDLTGDLVFRAAGAVPVAGRTLDVLRSVVVTADEVARELLPGAVETARTLTPERLHRPNGSYDVSVLRTAAGEIEALAAQTTRLRAGLRAQPRTYVVEQVREGEDLLGGQLEQLAAALTKARQVVRLAPPLLGADRPRRYFVLVQQPGESRGTGGLPGGFAVVEASQGRLRVTAQGTDADLRNGEIPVPQGVSAEYVANYAHNGAFRLWQNVNLSPDLPTVAKVVEARWRAQGGGPLDGVIALDPIALADLLQGGPPLQVSNGRRVPVAQLVHYLAIEQYRDFPMSDTSRRKDALSGVAATAARRLSTGGDPAALLRGLGAAVRSGHLRMASDDPALQSGLHDAGVDGALPQGAAPVAYAVVNNSTEGKQDHFLDRALDYVAGSCVEGRRGSTITIRLRNAQPASGLPPYVTIFNNGDRTVQSSTSATLLTVYGTRGARLQSASLDGVPLSARIVPGRPHLESGTEKGLPFWNVYVLLPRTQTRTLVLSLDEPAAAGSVRIPEQPLSRPLRVTSAVGTCD